MWIKFFTNTFIFLICIFWHFSALMINRAPLSVLSTLETSWQLHYINSHLPLPLPLAVTITKMTVALQAIAVATGKICHAERNWWVYAVFVVTCLHEVIEAPRGARAPLSPLSLHFSVFCPFYLFLILLALTILFFCPYLPFPFYQNSPTPFPDRRS